MDGEPEGNLTHTPPTHITQPIKVFWLVSTSQRVASCQITRGSSPCPTPWRTPPPRHQIHITEGNSSRRRMLRGRGCGARVEPGSDMERHREDKRGTRGSKVQRRSLQPLNSSQVPGTQMMEGPAGCEAGVQPLSLSSYLSEKDGFCF